MKHQIPSNCSPSKGSCANIHCTCNFRSTKGNQEPHNEMSNAIGGIFIAIIVILFLSSCTKYEEMRCYDVQYIQKDSVLLEVGRHARSGLRPPTSIKKKKTYTDREGNKFEIINEFECY